MDKNMPAQLIGSDIHGFRTMDDLDIPSMMEEATTRWLRPNEIHAILCNFKYFTIHVKPVNLPRSGTIVLFDRKKLRNFRKDGHNWKKKKDGKTVKEAHEHLKVGNEERIHVYYAHGEDIQTFVRRCYWLLDKSMEHIVLVHYRETQESQGSPATPMYSSPSSGVSDPNASWPLSEEADSVVDPTYFPTRGTQLQTKDSSSIKSHEMRLREINTLEWDELVVPADPSKMATAEEGKTSSSQQTQFEINGFKLNGDSISAIGLPEQCIEERLPGKIAETIPVAFNIPDNISFQRSGGRIISGVQENRTGVPVPDIVDGLRNLEQDVLQSQDSFGQWINSIITESPTSVVNPILESPITTSREPFSSTPLNGNQSSTLGHIFSITDVSPTWAPSSEETKILVVGAFHRVQPQMPNFSIYCVCGRTCVPAEELQPGVFRCLISPQAPGLVNLFLSFDGQKPISETVTFEFRAPLVNNWMVPSEEKFSLEEFKVQMRLARLLFSSSKILNVLSGKVSASSLKEAKKFARRTTQLFDNWTHFVKSIEDSKFSSSLAKDNLFELMLQHRLWDWLLERVIEGSKLSERDEQGQGVIHLCAIMGYTWAVYPFSWAGQSLDYRDKFGWTPLHWAAYYGREKMIVTLQSAGAKSYLVTDPTAENPGGLTAADLASKNGYVGLAAFLAEKALVEHFRDMKLAGNADGSLHATSDDTVVPGNFTEEELYLKDSLSAYRTAADAAARIQAAFREHSLKVQTKAVESSNPEIDARNIIAAMKIQHAFRNFETRKQMAAAARIQYRFRTWKIRKDFLNMRRQTIKIQSIFRGFQVRRQYRKLTWSVGVLEKAILRWRLKRKGFRGLQVNISEEVDQKQENSGEEDFFHASRKQAEERVERSVVKVQAMFRSKRAQEEYRRMKLEHNKASAEYEGLLDADMDMN